MSPPKSELAYQHIREVLRRALDSPRGVKVAFPSKGMALKFRQNAYTLRTRDRQLTERIYDIDSPMRGTSEFDSLTILAPVPEGERWVLEIQKISAALSAIEVEELE